MNAFMLEDAKGVPVGNPYASSQWQFYSDLIDTETPRNIRVNIGIGHRGMVELDLCNKDLKDMPTEVFNFTRVEVLRLANNQIQAVPPAIAGLHRLRILDLHMNKVSYLPDTISNCHYLQEIDLSFNRMKVLPVSFGYCHNLKVLKLKSNHFDAVPHQVGQLVGLRVLDLQANKLWHLPFNMQNMRGLKWLSLGNNFFEQLPIPVCNIRNLEVLILKNNSLTVLPTEMENLKFLRELNLAGNKFEEVPYVLITIKNLRHLNLSRNKLRVLPQRLSRLGKLKTLHIQHNQIQSIPNNLSTVEYLNVSYNRLHNFSVGKLHSLRYLNADNNMLENVPLGLFSLPNIEVIKLAFNRIQYISIEIGHLRHLRSFDVGNNKLIRVPFTVIKGLNLEYFNMKGNPIADYPVITDLDENEYVTDIDTIITGGGNVYPNKHQRPTYSDGELTSDKKNDDGADGVEDGAAQTGQRKQVSFGGGVKSRVRQSKQRGPSRGHSTQGTSADESSGPGSPTAGSSFHFGAVDDMNPRTLITDDVEEKYPIQNGHHDDDGSVHSHDMDVHEYGGDQRQEREKSPFDHLSSSGHYNMDTTSRKRREPLKQRTRSRSPKQQGRTARKNGMVKAADYGLLGMVSHVESLLNEDLLHPVISHKSVHPVVTHSIFKRSGMEDYHSKHNHGHHPYPSKNQNGLLRLRADCFRVTKAGGMFRSTVDPNVKVYFPANAVSTTMDVILQIEKIDHEALLVVKRQNKIVDNIISMGHIIHLGQSRNMNFNEQVTLTIPAPPAPRRGKLHILTFKEDNSCTPSTTGYRVRDGYITIQAWHFCGKGAILTKSRCKYKACKSVEQLLKYMYI